MKKLLTFLMLLCMVCTGAWAGVTIASEATAVENLTATKLYAIYVKQCYQANTGGGTNTTNVGYLYKHSSTGSRIKANNAFQTDNPLPGTWILTRNSDGGITLRNGYEGKLINIFNMGTGNESGFDLGTTAGTYKAEGSASEGYTLQGYDSSNYASPNKAWLNYNTSDGVWVAYGAERAAKFQFFEVTITADNALTEQYIPDGTYYIRTYNDAMYDTFQPYVTDNGNAMRLTGESGISGATGIWKITQENTSQSTYAYSIQSATSGNYWTDGGSAPLGSTRRNYAIEYNAERKSYTFRGHPDSSIESSIANKNCVTPTNATAFGRTREITTATDADFYELIPAPAVYTVTYTYKLNGETVGTETFNVSSDNAYPTPTNLPFYTYSLPTGTVTTSGSYDVNITWNGPFEEGKYYRLGVRLGSGGSLSKYVKYNGTNAKCDASYTTTEDATMWRFERVSGTIDQFRIFNYGAKKYAATNNGAATTFTDEGTTYKLFEYTGTNHVAGNKDFGFVMPTNATQVYGDHQSGLGYWNNGQTGNEGSAFRVIEIDSQPEDPFDGKTFVIKSAYTGYTGKALYNDGTKLAWKDYVEGDDSFYFELRKQKETHVAWNTNNSNLTAEALYALYSAKTDSYAGISTWNGTFNMGALNTLSGVVAQEQNKSGMFAVGAIAGTAPVQYNFATKYKTGSNSTDYSTISLTNAASYTGSDRAATTYNIWATPNGTESWTLEEVEESNDPITSLSQLSYKRAYTISTYRRGNWTAYGDNNYIYQTNGKNDSNAAFTSASNKTADASDPDQQWAILKSAKGNYYLYNVGKQKFFTYADNYSSRYSIANLAAEPNSSALVLVNSNTSHVTSKAWYTADNSLQWNIGMKNGSTNYLFAITNWAGGNSQNWRVFQNNTDLSNGDEGMYFKIVPVEGSFDFSEALEKIRQFEFEPITYTISADGKPDCVTVAIEGKEIDGVWAQGIEYVASKTLANSDVVVTTDDGYVATFTVDNTNNQINFSFRQLFVPIAHDGDLQTANKYVIKNAAQYYVKHDNGNLPGTQTRSEADKFVFVKHATLKGQYYIYDVVAEKYITYNATGNGNSVNVQSSSKVQLANDQASAKCWVFDGQGHITPSEGGTAGWNFTGGAREGYVLNLFSNDDSNSIWDIVDGNKGSLACAVTMFSEPGREYMHKLVPENGVSVTGIELLDGLTGLELKTDREGKGNNYAYVHGFAPTEEGVYHYNVCLSDDTKAPVTLTVSNFLQAPTPGMVWVSWNWFESRITADKLTKIAEGMVSKGLVEAGYNTIVIDDAWGVGTLGSPSTLAVNTSKFSDMKGFVDGVNAKGIKVGIYSDAAGKTCGSYQPGSFGVEEQHLRMFDSWGIDFLKYDFCFGSNAYQSYKTMGDAIAKLNDKRKDAGNKVPFVFNACEWGQNSPHTWAAEAGSSMWRATSDARECWVGNMSLPGVLAGSDRVRNLWMYAGVNRFNDLDMMCIGLHGLGSPSNYVSGHTSNGGSITGLTEEQARTQMSIWSMFASPLSLSCDVREAPAFEGNQTAGIAIPNPLVTDADLAILKNADIIRVSQDPLGQQAEYMASLGDNTNPTGNANNPTYATTGVDVYVKDMVGGQKALAFVNRNANGTATPSAVDMAAIYLDNSKTYTVKEVWSGETFTVEPASHQINPGTLNASQTKVYIISEVVQAKVTQPESEHTGGLNGKFVGTFSSTYNVELPEGYKAYTATVEGSNVLFNQLGEEGNRLVPANTGVLLYAEEGVDAQNATPVRFADVEVGENAFRPTTGGEIPVGSYILANKQWNGVCFYQINPESRVVAKGKAYLVLPELPATVQAFSFGFDFEQEATTGINSLESIGVKGASYDLQGRRVSAKAKGVTIVNGTKVIR